MTSTMTKSRRLRIERLHERFSSGEERHTSPATRRGEGTRDNAYRRAMGQLDWAHVSMSMRTCGRVGSDAAHEWPRPEVRRLTWGLLEAGLPQPSLRAQHRMSDWLDELTPVVSNAPVLSDDGEGGLFAEWIAGGDRVTIHVDRIGDSVLRGLRQGAWRDVPRTSLWAELRRLEALISSAKAAVGSRGPQV